MKNTDKKIIKQLIREVLSESKTVKLPIEALYIKISTKEDEDLIENFVLTANYWTLL